MQTIPHDNTLDLTALGLPIILPGQHELDVNFEYSENLFTVTKDLCSDKPPISMQSIQWYYTM